MNGWNRAGFDTGERGVRDIEVRIALCLRKPLCNAFNVGMLGVMPDNWLQKLANLCFLSRLFLDSFGRHTDQRSRKNEP